MRLLFGNRAGVSDIVSKRNVTLVRGARGSVIILLQCATVTADRSTADGAVPHFAGEAVPSAMAADRDLLNFFSS